MEDSKLEMKFLSTIKWVGWCMVGMLTIQVISMSFTIVQLRVAPAEIEAAIEDINQELNIRGPRISSLESRVYADRWTKLSDLEFMRKFCELNNLQMLDHAITKVPKE